MPVSQYGYYFILIIKYFDFPIIEKVNVRNRSLFVRIRTIKFYLFFIIVY